MPFLRRVTFRKDLAYGYAVLRLDIGFPGKTNFRLDEHPCSKGKADPIDDRQFDFAFK
jgi:hypothetical protein